MEHACQFIIGLVMRADEIMHADEITGMLKCLKYDTFLIL